MNELIEIFTLGGIVGITSSVNAQEFFNEESTIRIYFCDFDCKE
tara:strand:- start:162 stop:293 length:132 start_codon:yes stop_codon:yes gene_type:complete